MDRPRPGCATCYLTVECVREDLVEVTLVTGDSGAIGEGNSDPRNFCGRMRRLYKVGVEIKETRPFSRGLRGCRLPVGAVDEGIRTIPEQPTFRNLSGVQLLSHHGLDGISPKRNYRTKLDLRSVCHTSPPCLLGTGHSSPRCRTYVLYLLPTSMEVSTKIEWAPVRINRLE